MNTEVSNQTGVFFKRIRVAGLICFVLTAWFSKGYHHPDEHFQIIEFANFKLGNISQQDLPWEFHGQIRPGLAVFIAAMLFKFFGFLGITNPFLLAFILRFCVAVWSWWIISKLAFHIQSQFKTEAGKKIGVFLLFFAWFMPYLSVRFSSENLSAAAFLTALWLILTHVQKGKGVQVIYLISAGLFLGFSFYFRFQMAFAIAGLGLWLIAVHKLSVRFVFFVLAGGVLALFFGVLADFWLYGKWVLSPVNYYTANIIQDIASGFGVTPWWDYFYLTFLQAIPPLSLVLLLFFFWGAVKNLKGIFLWSIVPFLIGHFLVGHKEMRFMFPMIVSFLILAAVSIDDFIARKKYLTTAKIVGVILLVINTPLLVGRSILPCREQTAYHEFLYHYAATQKINLITFESGIYENAALTVNFYKSPNVQNIILPNVRVFEKWLADEAPNEVYFISRTTEENMDFVSYRKETCYSFIPNWVLSININNWTSRANIWTIHKLNRQ